MICGGRSVKREACASSHVTVAHTYICRIGFVMFKSAESAQNALKASDDDLCLDNRYKLLFYLLIIIFQVSDSILRVSLPRKPKKRSVGDEGGGVVCEGVSDVETSAVESGGGVAEHNVK